MQWPSQCSSQRWWNVHEKGKRVCVGCGMWVGRKGQHRSKQHPGSSHWRHKQAGQSRQKEQHVSPVELEVLSSRATGEPQRIWEEAPLHPPPPHPAQAPETLLSSSGGIEDGALLSLRGPGWLDASRRRTSSKGYLPLKTNPPPTTH